VSSRRANCKSNGVRWSLWAWNAVLGCALVAGAVLGACGKVESGDPNHVEVRSSECITCHRKEYEATTSPPHVGTFPETCGSCHTQTEWVPAKFQHPWPLVGAHLKAGCAACHKGNPPVYKGTPNQCVDCHKADYDSSPYPGHQAFPLTCNDCHSTLAWKPASPVAHPFPLDGAHAVTPCASCHVGNPPVYQGTPNTCVGCHQADYDSSPYPGHQSFPTTCADCHSTTAWKPASGGAHPENQFPIANGTHQMPCADCHNSSLGPNGKGNADCVGCHTGEHTRAKMDGKHNDVGGYPSGAAPQNFCLECHPNGKN
jgi:hypothetical protein